MTLEELNRIIEKAKQPKQEPKVDKGKESVLRATGRPGDYKETPARSAADVIAGEKAFEQFRKLKEEL